MTEWWFYIVAVFAPLFLVNGIPHFVHGVSGQQFPTPFSGGAGTLDTPVRNVFWGGGNLIVGGLLFWLISGGLNWALVIEMVVIGLCGGAFLGHVFANPDRFRRK